MADARPIPVDGGSLAGVIERIVFHNPENGFAVLQVQIRGRREPATVVGSLLTPQLGEQVEATGEWVVDPRHGQQFRANALRSVLPTSPDGIEKYLASGRIKGIGKRVAAQLIQRFGAELFDVLDRHPERLREIKGIGRSRQKMILESWGQERAAREAMIFLNGHGIGAARAVRVFKRYGHDAITRIRQNPWCLA